MIKAAVIGAACAGIPLTLVLVQKQQTSKDLQNNLSYYENREKQYQYMTLYYVEQDMTAGEALTEDCLAERQIQSIQDLSTMICDQKEDLVGMRLKVSLKKGTCVTADLLYEGEVVAEDERRIELNSANVPKSLKKNEFVDIRISFPNGEDYIVASHKQIYELQRDEELGVVTIQMRFSEQELLRYQAAFVDVKTYTDTSIYCLQYTGDFQTAAKEFYPVNRNVFDLMQWDPNITNRFYVDDELQRRERLEEHMKDYLLEKPVEEPSNTQEPEYESITDTSDPMDFYTQLPE